MIHMKSIPFMVLTVLYILLQIHVHSSLESLNEFVPQDMLPEEYGGKAGPIADINRKSETQTFRNQPL